MGDLHRFLIDYKMAQLRALAQNRGVYLSTNRQSEAASLLAEALMEPLSVRIALSQLSPEGQRALDTLVAAGGRMRAPHFSRRFGQVRPIGPGRLERESAWQKPANATEELVYLGLVFRAFFEDEDGPGEFFAIPDDLLPLLPTPRVRPPLFRIERVAVPGDEQVRRSTLDQELFAYLVYIQTHDVRPYADGRLARRDLDALQAIWGGTDERQIALMKHLIEQHGFVRHEGGFLRLASPAVRRWLTTSPLHRWTILQETWRDDPTWNDLCRVPSLICDEQAGWQNDPARTRKTLLGLLARCPADEWWSMHSFIGAVKDFHPDFQRPDGDYGSWYIRDAESGEYLTGFDSWDQVEGALLADLLTGALSWLDVVVTTDQENDRACRLTKGGAHLVGLLDLEIADQEPSPIIIRSDLGVEVPSPPNLYTRFQLERFAEMETADPCIYRLTVRGLSRALDRGIQVEQILAFLRRASQDHLPANVTGQIMLWAGRFRTAHLEETVLLRVQNEQVLNELRLLPETRPLIGDVLSPTAARVQKQDVARLRHALQELGYLPPPEAGEEPSQS